MKNSNKQGSRDFDYLWDHYSVYTPEQSTRVISKCTDTANTKRIEGSLKNAVDLLYSNRAVTADYMGDAGMRGIQIGLCTVGKKSYLTDNGATLRQLEKHGWSRRELISALKGIASDFTVTVMNDEICIELQYAEDLADYYRNLVNVITKIKLIGGTCNVHIKEKEGTQKKRGRKISI